MKSVLLWTLVVVNALLLLGFIGRVQQDNSAIAQPAAARRPGDYLMIPGEVIGGINGLVYVLDTVNGQLSAMTWDDSQKRLAHMRPIDLGAVFQQARQNQPRRGN